MRDDAPPSVTTGTADSIESGESEQERAQAAELSRAAREAVRQPADPRLDRQLARMGLAAPATEEAPASGNVDREPSRPDRAEELEALRSTLASTGTALADVTRRVDALRWVVAIEGVAIALLAVLLMLR